MGDLSIEDIKEMSHKIADNLITNDETSKYLTTYTSQLELRMMGGFAEKDVDAFNLEVEGITSEYTAKLNPQKIIEIPTGTTQRMAKNSSLKNN